MRRAPLTLAVALAATLAGCGGEDRLTAEDYRTEMGKICRESKAQRDRIEAPTRLTQEAIADYFTRLRDNNARMIERIEGLEPPEELDAAHERTLEASRKGREEVERLVSELERTDDLVGSLRGAREDIIAVNREVSDAIKRLGVPDCSLILRSGSSRG